MTATKAAMSQNGKGQMPRAKIEEITPAKAKKLLSGNTHNRNVRQIRVERLTGAIQRGEWVLNGEPIQLADDGTVLNGQHRLLAVVEADIPVQMLVVRGVPMVAQETIDTGAARSVGDMLKLRGYSNAANLAAAARHVWAYDNLGALHPRELSEATPQQVIATVEANPQMQEWTKVAGQVSSKLALPKAWGTSLGFLFARDWDPQDAETFMVRLAYGEDLTSTDPIFVLRNQLLAPRVRVGGRNSRTLPPRYAAAYTVKAMRAWVFGDQPTFYKWVPGGRKAEPFPQVPNKEEVEA